MKESSNNMFGRRQLFRTAGAAAGGLYLPSLMGSDRAAYAALPPKRFVVFNTDHGPNWGLPTQPDRWQMRRPGLPETFNDWEFPFDDADPMSFPVSMRPLHAIRQDILILEGLAQTSAFADPGFGGNGHASSTSNLLSAQGGVRGPSIDQIVSQGIAGTTPFKYLFYANGSCDCWSQSPFWDVNGKQLQPGRMDFDYLGSTFDKLFGNIGVPPVMTGPPSPADLSKQHRKGTLDFVRGEYTKLLPKVGSDDRIKLQSHIATIASLQDQIASLQQTQLACTKPARPAASLPYKQRAETIMSTLFPVAMACDLTRVGMFGDGEVTAVDIGAMPTTLAVHADVAHAATKAPMSTWMANYDAIFAGQFANMVKAFKSVPEGNGTMLDNSILLWAPELGSGWHNLYANRFIVAGGKNLGFRPGRYIKYAENQLSPKNGYDIRTPESNGAPSLGPAHSKLFVSIAQAFGISRNSVGIATTLAKDGKTTIDMTGPLPRLT